MKLIRTLTRTRLRATLFTALVAIPLMGAEGCPGDLIGAAEDYDGTYTLTAVNGRSIGSGIDITYVDPQNRLVLTRGEWTVSGSSLETRMWTTMIIRGATTREARFNPERHTGTITISGSTATATLDNGRRITATIGDGSIVTDDAGNRLTFRK